jgi:hypothetical protein
MTPKGLKGRFGLNWFGKHLPTPPARFPLVKLLGQLFVD